MSAGAGETAAAGEAGAAAGTVKAALARATARLQAAGCASPRLDAEILLAEVLGTDRAGLVTAAHSTLGREPARAFETLLARREAREPVAYIVGRKPFRHLELHVDRRVLIPRPDSEVLVEAGLDLPRKARVVEIGTGSGAVALALKHERPDLEVTATDVDPGALAVAEGNARRLGLDVAFRRADLLDGAGGPFDALLANVPYVSEADYARLDPEIARYEPRLAVVADGDEGLTLIRRLAAQLDGIPFAALEVGLAQEERVAEILRAKGYDTATLRDLSGIERVVVGRR